MDEDKARKPDIAQEEESQKDSKLTQECSLKPKVCNKKPLKTNDITRPSQAELETEERVHLKGYDLKYLFVSGRMCFFFFQKLLRPSCHRLTQTTQ